MFKVGDKVKSKANWDKDFYYGKVVEVGPEYITCDWVLKADGSVHRASYLADRLYFLESNKKGLCKFLDKVEKEYSK